MISKEPAELTVETRVVEEQEQAWLSGFSLSSRRFLQSQPFLTSSSVLDLMKGFMFFFPSPLVLRKWSEEQREHHQRFEAESRVPVSMRSGVLSWWLCGESW